MRRTIWGHESNVVQPATLWSRMSNSAQMRTTAQTDPNCAKKIKGDMPAFNVIRYYSYEGVDEDAASEVCASWVDATLILTVHVKSDSIHVAVKVAKFHGSDPNILARALAIKTHAMYGSGRKEVVRHKKTLDDYGAYGSTFINQANSDRPAFVIHEGSPDSSDAALLHHYCAMSLPNEHAMQQTLLAKCKTSRMAACFTHVASVALQVDIIPSLITGDPDKCPSFFTALLDIGAELFEDKLFPQETKILGAPELAQIRQEIDDLVHSVHTPTVTYELPSVNFHVQHRETASDSEEDDN